MTKQLATLAFFVKVHDFGWHSFQKSMVPQIRALQKKGFLAVNWTTNQAHFTGKTWA